jgi:hypothetical protein
VVREGFEIEMAVVALLGFGGRRPQHCKLGKVIDARVISKRKSSDGIIRECHKK